MEERKWTPGTWVNKDGMSVIVKGSGASVGYPPEQGAIASLYDGEYIENRNVADAHLIAAAPDLYEALDRVVREMPFGDEPEFARAALAKAKGEKHNES